MSNTNVNNAAARNFTAEQVALMKQQYKKQNQLVATWKQFKKNKMAVFGLTVFIIMVIIAVSCSFIFDYEKDIVEQHIMERFQGFSREHPLGTDQFGRDILKRVLWGGRVSLFCGLGAVTISLTFGSVLGAAAGFFGGYVDDVIMRFMDILLSIPETLLAISLVAAFGTSLPVLLFAMAVGQIPKLSRLVRSQVLTLKNEQFVEAARCCGTKNSRIIFKHILPNAVGPIIVNCTLTVARSILTIAGLSFIGLGLQPPNPEWGAMLSEAKMRLIDYPYLIVAPGIAIILTVMSLTMAGDGLRDALDPKMRH